MTLLSTLKTLLKIFLLTTLICLILSLYPAAPSSPQKSPKALPTVELNGPLSVNHELDAPTKLYEDHLFGPESFAFHNGHIYAGILGGDIICFDPDDPSSGVSFETRVAPPCGRDRHPYDENVCGRVLGLEFDANGDLIFADAYFGLYKWKLSRDPDSDPIPLVPSNRLVDGRPNLITNSLTISKKTGIVYFTSSSSWVSLSHSMPEVLGLNPSGRVMTYDPKTDAVAVLIDRVPFANGIQLSSDESFFVFNSCGDGLVFKHYLDGPKAGSTEKFFQPPGIPDNISPSPNGGFLVGVVGVEKDRETRFFSIPSPLRLLREYPFLKTGYGNLILNLNGILSKIDEVIPSHLIKTAKLVLAHTETGARLAPPHALVVEVDGEGNAVRSFHGTNGQLRAICEGFVVGNWMYLGSPYPSMDSIARVPFSGL